MSGIMVQNGSKMYSFIVQLIITIPYFLLITGSDGVNMYGREYGRTWVYFADERGAPLYVDMALEPYTGARLGVITSFVHFRLYTRENPDDYEEIVIDDEDKYGNSYNEVNYEDGLYFNPDNPVKVITHGWVSSADSPSVQLVKDAYLRAYDYNVVAVDWRVIAGDYFYPFAALSTRLVGKRVAAMLHHLRRRYGVPGSRVHLIGHSLGSHVMGYAGAYYRNGSVARITGLDPARPMFEVPPFGPTLSLDPRDADFVDVIHTCAGVLGYRSALGHVDFYPNSGYPSQPGCSGLQYIAEACSHSRAYIFFAESIDVENAFVSYPCDSWKSFEAGNCFTNSTLMGDPVDPASRGDYYLYTNSESPFAKA